MKQYRSTFILYCIIWVCLVLLPAAWVLVRGNGIPELQRTYAEAGRGLFRHLFNQDAEPPPESATASSPSATD